ncbi:MAG: septum formation protein Maf [Ignavibacteriae bacterium]|jgi:septum formation protein|nr:septum formation protein Maf [Ignavibacteriota bacterium]NOG98764.1 septum formation protein Maf [Ignavibacteriota bacterium]
MVNTKLPIYLASKSPRRRKLLKSIKLNFKTFSVDLAEEVFDAEHPIKTVKRLANEKLKQAEKSINDAIIITADTIVVLDNEIIGKPVSKKNAVEILSRLSGNSHLVYTGYSIKNLVSAKQVTDYAKTKVKFRELSKKEIKDYVDRGSPMDKAGAYGIQDDYGSVFIEKINGCYYNVVGLPLSKVYQSLQEVI